MTFVIWTGLRQETLPQFCSVSHRTHQLRAERSVAGWLPQIASNIAIHINRELS